MTEAETVSLIASIATIIASLAIVVTAVIYWHQLRTMTKARETDSVLAIMNHANSQELRRARYLMLEHHEILQDLYSDLYSWGSKYDQLARLKYRPC